MSAALKEDAHAFVSDLIVERQNDNELKAGEPGRTLANGDLLRVEAIGEHELTVSAAYPAGRAGGERTWSAPFTIAESHAREHCDLGYDLAHGGGPDGAAGARP